MSVKDSNGIRLVVLNNPDAEETSFAFGVNAGYFEEDMAGVSEGIANLVMDSIVSLEKEQEAGKDYIHRRGHYGPFSTVFYMEGRNKEVRRGAKILWDSIRKFGLLNEPKVDLRHVDLK